MNAETMTLEEQRKARRAESQRRWRERNREALNARHQEYRAKMSPEQAAQQKERRLKWNAEHREARQEARRKLYTEKPEISVLSNIKSRARKAGLPFNLTIEDVMPPEFCPILGIKLERNRAEGRNAGPHEFSPSVDRIIPELGYVKGNVIVISQLANAIKQNATPEQIRKVADFYERLLNGGES